MTAYDQTIRTLIEQMRTELEGFTTFADAKAEAIHAIRTIEQALRVAIGTHSLNLPNLGSDTIPLYGLRVRGRDPGRKLERVRFDEKSPPALIVTANGQLCLALVDKMQVGITVVADSQLQVEDLVGVVRCVREALRRNRDLVDRIQEVRTLARRIEDWAREEAA